MPDLRLVLQPSRDPGWRHGSKFPSGFDEAIARATPAIPGQPQSGVRHKQESFVRGFQLRPRAQAHVGPATPRAPIATRRHPGSLARQQRLRGADITRVTDKAYATKSFQSRPLLAQQARLPGTKQTKNQVIGPEMGDKRIGKINADHEKDPWEKLTMRDTPKIRDSPAATRNNDDACARPLSSWTINPEKSIIEGIAFMAQDVIF